MIYFRRVFAIMTLVTLLVMIAQTGCFAGARARAVKPGPSCAKIASWARGLVANKQEISRSSLGNPDNSQVYPANLHLCYNCRHSDGTPGVVVLGGHGGWSHFYPAVVNVQRNCNCGTANMNISY